MVSFLSFIQFLLFYLLFLSVFFFLLPLLLLRRRRLRLIDVAFMNYYDKVESNEQEATISEYNNTLNKDTQDDKLISENR